MESGLFMPSQLLPLKNISQIDKNLRMLMDCSSHKILVKLIKLVHFALPGGLQTGQTHAS